MARGCMRGLAVMILYADVIAERRPSRRLVFFSELVGVNVYAYGDPSPAAQNDAYGGKAFP